MAELPPWLQPALLLTRRAGRYLADRALRVLRRRREFAAPLALLGLLGLYLGIFSLGVAFWGGPQEPDFVLTPTHPTHVPEVAEVAAADYEAGEFNEPVESVYVEHVEVPPAGQLDGSLPVGSSGGTADDADIFAGDTAIDTTSDPAELFAYSLWFGVIALLVLLANLRLLAIRIYDGRWVPAWRRLDRWLEEA